jgi:hypothetical protein
MEKTLVFFVSLLAFVSGLQAVDGVIEIPKTRFVIDGIPTTSLQYAGKAFTVDAELRLHLMETPQEIIVPEYQSPAWMLHSLDSGKTWFQDYTTPDQCNWNDLTSDDEGNLYLVWHDAGSGIFFMKSADGGEHWSTPVTLVAQPPEKDSLLPVFPQYPSISAAKNKL